MTQFFWRGEIGCGQLQVPAEGTVYPFYSVD